MVHASGCGDREFSRWHRTIGKHFNSARKDFDFAFCKFARGWICADNSAGEIHRNQSRAHFFFGARQNKRGVENQIIEQGTVNSYSHSSPFVLRVGTPCAPRGAYRRYSRASAARRLAVRSEKPGGGQAANLSNAARTSKRPRSTSAAKSAPNNSAMVSFVAGEIGM